MKQKLILNLKKFSCIVIGVSAGGMEALTRLFAHIPKDFPLSILVVQHMHKLQNDYFITHHNSTCILPVKEAEEKEKIRSGTIYFAPPDYHLLVEEDETLALSVDEKVNYSRPSIDVLFESAADVYKEKLIGIILTGANNDGAEGMRIIKQNGGFTIAQDPQDAEFPVMPQSAIDLVEMDRILSLKEMTTEFIRWDQEDEK